MLIYILKSSVCLAVFLIFYKFLLEKESVHVFKRFYLLCALIFSIGIPFITFTYYVVPSEEIVSQIIEGIPLENNVLNLKSQTNYIPIILWSIYVLGVCVFGIKFLYNLSTILNKIRRNPKYKSGLFTNVLLKNLIIPHTFFSYIFLNKHKFETQQIPDEVFIHEQTHAQQKHSIDILIIEVLQVLFWFNPLLYLIKKDIKLNHEFLADKAVLNNGFDTSTYQNTLLTFSSNFNEPLPIVIGMANAINYSLIKKRFTVMKTQTSKKRIWLRSFLLLPLLAILLYSFSTKVIVQEEKINIVEQELISIQKKATKKLIAEYNRLAKHYNEQPKDEQNIKLKDVERLKYLYDLMSEKQKKNAEPFPNFPPSPPPTPEVPKAPNAPKVIERKIVSPPIPNAPTSPKVIEVKNAQIAAKLKYVEEKNRLQQEKIAYKETQVAARTELIAAKLKYIEDRKQLQKEKSDKIKAEKGKLIKVREARSVEEIKKLKKEKLAFKETQVAARTKLISAKLKYVEERKLLQKEKLAHREAIIKAKQEKIKDVKGELIKVRELRSDEEIKKMKEEKELKKKSKNKEN